MELCSFFLSLLFVFLRILLIFLGLAFLFIILGRAENRGLRSKHIGQKRRGFFLTAERVPIITDDQFFPGSRNADIKQAAFFLIITFGIREDGSVDSGDEHFFELTPF